MQLEKEKQRWARELAEKESEMDELRFHTQKKIKAVEMQLEEESELTSTLQREKRDAERRLRELIAHNQATQQRVCHGAALDEYVVKLRRQQLKYKTLAVDAQTQLDKLKQAIPKQSIMRALKSQLEDSEIAKANALKAKQLLQVELADVHEQLRDACAQKQASDEQCMHLTHEVANMRALLDEQERDTDELLKKYHAHLNGCTLDGQRFVDLNAQLDALGSDNRTLRERIRELEERLIAYEATWVERAALGKLETRCRELECKLELESVHKQRLHSQLERVRQQSDKVAAEREHVVAREKRAEEALKKSQRLNRDAAEEIGEMRKRLVDADEAKKRCEQQNDILERELDAARDELKTVQTRLDAFTNAFNLMSNEDDDDDDDEDEEEEEEEEEEEVDGNETDELDEEVTNSGAAGSGGGSAGQEEEEEDDDDDEIVMEEEIQEYQQTRVCAAPNVNG